MTFPTPPGDQIQASPTIFAYPPQVPGINSSTFPAVTTPSVPATTVAQANTTGVDVMVYITSGGAAVTVIKVNGTTTGLNLGTATTSSASVYLPAGASISLTYASTAPTWVWLAV
jgi:hypothetical protein